MTDAAPGRFRQLGLVAVRPGVAAGAQIMVVELADQFLRFLAAVHPQQRVDLGLDPVVILLRRRRADVEEISEADDLPDQLQELGLPILERVAAHFAEIVGPFGPLPVLGGLVQIGLPTEIPVQAQRNQEESERDPEIGIAFHNVLRRRNADARRLFRRRRDGTGAAMAWAPDGFDLDGFVAAALAEDLGEAGDITSAAVIPEDSRFAGVMRTREAVIVAGLPVAEAFFRALDPEVEFDRPVEDGARCAAGDVLLELSGKARALLAAERAALNSLQHLTGIATLTRLYVDSIDGTGAILLDTRKTVPGLRFLEKYATRIGGAQNHRMGLWDAAMIKDNHIAVAGSVAEAVRRAVAAGIARIIVEVDRLDQIAPALAAGATHLLLDNMGPAALELAVAEVAGRVPTEASGGLDLDTIRAAAETGVTYVSVGRLTQSAPAADIGLDFAAL
jgi:nicotinate-nucleotide pyrophosphorylase (carboxylating)